MALHPSRRRPSGGPRSGRLGAMPKNRRPLRLTPPACSTSTAHRPTRPCRCGREIPFNRCRAYAGDHQRWPSRRDVLGMVGHRRGGAVARATGGTRDPRAGVATYLLGLAFEALPGRAPRASGVPDGAARSLSSGARGSTSRRPRPVRCRRAPGAGFPALVTTRPPRQRERGRTSLAPAIPPTQPPTVIATEPRRDQHATRGTAALAGPVLPPATAPSGRSRAGNRRRHEWRVIDVIAHPTLAEVLALLGHDADLVVTCPRAWRLRPARPQVVITDFLMPGLTASRLRRLSRASTGRPRADQRSADSPTRAAAEAGCASCASRSPSRS